MIYLRFRAAQSIQVGHKLYQAGEEFVLREDEVKRLLSSADFRSGRLICCGEVSGEEMVYVDETSKTYKDGRSVNGGSSVPLSIGNLIPIPVVIDLSSSPVNPGNKWWVTAPCDCLVEGFEIFNLTPEEIAESDNLVFDIELTRNTNYASPSNSGSILEAPGFNLQRINDAYLSVNGASTDVTDEINDESASELVLDDTLNNGGYLYVGFYDRFCGLLISMETGNATGGAETIICEYPQLQSDGSIEWTPLTVTDNTIGDIGVTLEQNGTLSWNIPADWSPTIINGGHLYYVRISIDSENEALTDDTAIDYANIVVRKLTPYDNIPFVHAGDTITLNLEATGSTGKVITGALYIRRVN